MKNAGSNVRGTGDNVKWKSNGSSLFKTSFLCLRVRLCSCMLVKIYSNICRHDQE